MRVIAYVVIMGSGVALLSTTAFAQRAPAGMQEALDRKYDILEQEADARRVVADAEAERLRAEAARVRDETSELRSGRRNSSYVVIASGDPMIAYEVPTYRLRNGRVMRFSNEIRPAPGVECISGCS